MDLKRCSKCGELKSLSEFYKDKSKKCGYKSRCKKCQDTKEKKEYLKEYRENHKDYYREKQAEFRERNREKLRERHREYYRENPEKHKTYLSWQIYPGKFILANLSWQIFVSSSLALAVTLKFVSDSFIYI